MREDNDKATSQKNKERKIFAIGGGGLYTDRFRDELIRFSGKEQPNFLFIPTAAYDSDAEVFTLAQDGDIGLNRFNHSPRTSDH